MAATPLRGSTGYAFHLERLLLEATNSVYATRNQVTARGIRQLWHGLCNYINVCLRSRKGVLLPALGTFVVGEALEDRYAAYKRYRPTFSLLEGRFGGVQQEQRKFKLLNRCSVVQLNYQAIAQDAGVHRSVAQQIVLEMLQRTAMHIVAGHAIQVDVPSVGQLIKNRAGRIEFVFDPLLVEALELGIRPETPAYSIAGSVAPSRPMTQASVMPTPLLPQTYVAALHHLLRLCKQSDKTNTQAVARLQLEQWLKADCREVLRRVDGATLMDLLDRHTFGTPGRFVHYNTFVQDLEKALAAGHSVAPSPVPQSPPRPLSAAYAPAPAGTPPPAPLLGAQAARIPSPQPLPPPAAQPMVPGRPVSPVSGLPYSHYNQNMLSPRSRAEFDDFNRFHFSQLRLGHSKRGVTPKVGQEPLNVEEVRALHAELSDAGIRAALDRARAPRATNYPLRSRGADVGGYDHVATLLQEAGWNAPSRPGTAASVGVNFLRSSNLGAHPQDIGGPDHVAEALHAQEGRPSKQLFHPRGRGGVHPVDVAGFDHVAYDLHTSNIEGIEERAAAGLPSSRPSARRHLLAAYGAAPSPAPSQQRQQYYSDRAAAAGGAGSAEAAAAYEEAAHPFEAPGNIQEAPGAPRDTGRVFVSDGRDPPLQGEVAGMDEGRWRAMSSPVQRAHADHITAQGLL